MERKIQDWGGVGLLEQEREILLAFRWGTCMVEGVRLCATERNLLKEFLIKVELKKL